jgi:hypothetical protein
LTQNTPVKYCPSCGQVSVLDALRCGRCGTDFAGQKPKIHPAILTACILLSCACVWYVVSTAWAGYQVHQAQARIQEGQEQREAEYRQQQERIRQADELPRIP